MTRHASEEHVEQQVVAAYLRDALKPPIFWTAIDHATKSAAEGGRKKAMGVKDGLADLWVFVPSAPPAMTTLVICIEMKRRELPVGPFRKTRRPAGTLSKAQVDRWPEMRAANIRLHIAYSVEDVVTILTSHGIPLHARLMSSGAVLRGVV